MGSEALKIIFAGTPQTAATVLRSLVESGFEIAAVVTRPDALSGRKQILAPSPVASQAALLGIPVIKTSQITKEQALEIESFKADLGVVVAFGSLLKRQVLSALPLGWINLHYSMLPELRGAAPVQHALVRGLKETGVTVFQIDEGMDTGDIYLAVPTEIHPNENAGRLLNRLTTLGISALKQVIPEIFAGLATKSQQFGSPSSAPKVIRVDAEIKWNRPAREIHAQVMGMNPEPVAWCLFHDQAFKILDTQLSISSIPPSPIDFDYKAGEISELDGRIFVGCANGEHLELITVHPAGKKEMSAMEWYRGKFSGKSLRFD